MQSETAWLDDSILDKALKMARNKAVNGHLVELFDACAARVCATEGADLSFMSSSLMQVFPLCEDSHWIVCVFVSLCYEPACLILDSYQMFSDMANPRSNLVKLVANLIASVERACETTIPKRILDVPQQSNGVTVGAGSPNA